MQLGRAREKRKGGKTGEKRGKNGMKRKKVNEEK